MRGSDPRPQLGPRRPEMAWPQRPAAAGDGGPRLVFQRGGGGQGEGEEHQWASGVPNPTSIRAEGQWRGEPRGGRRRQRRAAALQARRGRLEVAVGCWGSEEAVRRWRGSSGRALYRLARRCRLGGKRAEVGGRVNGGGGWLDAVRASTAS